MTRRTERIYRELEKYLKDKEITSEEEMQEEIKKFMDMYNSQTAQKKVKDARDYLDMAYEADNEKDALKYAKKALQLDKNCLDAEVIIEELTTEDMEVLKVRYEKLITKTEKRLKEAGIWTDENIGSFWDIVETRPYLRLRYSYLQLLINQGKFRKAIKECEDLLLLSKHDNLGVRHILMSLHAFFEDEVNANRLLKQYVEDTSTPMLLPMIALYYKLDNYKKAEMYLKKLNRVNHELVDFLFDLEDLENLRDFENLEMEEVINTGMYRVGSKEEIKVAIMDSPFLYATTVGLFPWIAERILPF